MKFSRDMFLQVVDWLMVGSLILAGFTMAAWAGGPFWGAGLYLICRHALAALTGDYIHERIGYRLLDLSFIVSLVVAGFAFSRAWGGGPFLGAFFVVFARFGAEALLKYCGCSEEK